MRRRTIASILLTGVAVAALGVTASGTPPSESAEKDLPATASEARGRAKLLHEALHATLQIVHHEYYRENEGLPLPAATFTRVFREMEARHGVGLRWIAVTAEAMNVDHKPRTEFEKNAAKALGDGSPEYESVDEGIYRRAGAITLSSECLRCHAPTRSSNKDRAAGLVITLRLRKP